MTTSPIGILSLATFFEKVTHKLPEKFFSLENTVLLPHIGTATHEARLSMLNLVIDNIISFFKTGRALTPVDLSV